MDGGRDRGEHHGNSVRTFLGSQGGRIVVVSQGGDTLKLGRRSFCPEQRLAPEKHTTRASVYSNVFFGDSCPLFLGMVEVEPPWLLRRLAIGEDVRIVIFPSIEEIWDLLTIC